VLDTVAMLTELTLRTYEINPGLVEEHANAERRITQGGYGERQVYELIQNAADELRASPGGRVHVVLTGEHLYCANEGTPVTPQGAETILRMGVSRKRGGQIGRFGVGVKSVLEISRTPQFFSTTGAFGFDAEWSAEEIIEATHRGWEQRRIGQAPVVEETPVLRMARPLDATAERRSDPVLEELLTWATTVVRLPLLPRVVQRLSKDLSGFPSGFQLFSNHVGLVTLENRHVMPMFRREIRVEAEGVRHGIQESRTGAHASTSRWRVFRTEHEVPDEVRSTAGELHDRVVIDVSWAVPDYTVNSAGRHTVPVRLGEFWAFFPTNYATTLSGMLNAAWKTSEDRQNLYNASPLNEELLRVAAQLVVDSLPQLVVAEDPAAYLSLLPGRAKESRNWACKYLTERFWKLAAQAPSLPDQDGVLRRPFELNIHPKELSPEALRLWAEYPGRPANWVHRSVDAEVIRHGKMEHILEAAGEKTAASVRKWLEALVADGSVEASKAAIRVLSHLIETGHSLAAEARQAHIVLTEGDRLVAPVAGRVFKRTVEDGLRDDLTYVNTKISDVPEMLSHLERIGVRDADAQGRFQSVLDQGFAGYTPESWTRFWELLRSAGGPNKVRDIQQKLTRPQDVLHVRTVDGHWRPLPDCLAPGPVVPGDASRDAHIAVDLTFHSDDQVVLRNLGLRERPVGGYRPEGDQWFEVYQDAVYNAYLKSLPASAPRIQKTTLRLEGAPMAGPLHLFTRLSEEGRAAFLRATQDSDLVENWTQQVGRSAATRKAIMSPIRWLIRKHGFVQTSQGLKPVVEAVGPQLAQYDAVLPVAQELSAAKASKLGLPTTIMGVPASRWAGLLEQTLVSEDDGFVGNAYATLLRVDFEDFPEGTRCRVGNAWDRRNDGEIAVAETDGEYRDLIRHHVPALLVKDKAVAEQMRHTWGMLTVAQAIDKRIRHVAAGEPVALVDAYPALRRLGGHAQGLFLQRCTELEEIVRSSGKGTDTRALASARVDSTVLVLDSASPLDALVAADKELGLGLGAQRCAAVLDQQEKDLQDKAHQARVNVIRHSESIIDKIARLIDEDDLCAGLPPGLLDSEIAERGEHPDAHRIGEMAYNAYGDGILRHYAKDIAAPFNSPRSFDGSGAALRFVTDLGFPDSFAGARIPRLPEREEVRGPVEFPALHDYQERLAANLFGLLHSRTPQRAMLTLPTGAGKTRVTAEGVIRWIRAEGAPAGPILWIAQTEELCEQAVQSWKFVWSKVGADQPLVIDRLWGGNTAYPVTDRPQLVVATDAKLRVCLDTDAYAWLRQPALVLIDEAHVAISRTYTGLLEQLGLTSRETRRHLVGLTATPFRNDDDLTRRLAQRFGNRRLDEGIFTKPPVAELQELGVLSQVEHRELRGSDVQLSADELAEMKKFTSGRDDEEGQEGKGAFLPRAAEQRLAEDQERNRAVLDEIAAMDEDWPILVFATSVAHAKLLAAKLGDRGISAAAIDSATPMAERRKRIEAFRAGEIRVITNYGVLSQGFDAPATRAVVIARPVYSANNYQQMIGRGLRGRKNGGKDVCLILNVRDNITNHQRLNERLAFDKFEHLWQKGDAR
jgi:superfamily II DNA or RNA helicase